MLSDRASVLWWLSPEAGWDALHDTVRVTVKRAQRLIIKAQVSSIWAKGCMFDDCVRVI